MSLFRMLPPFCYPMYATTMAGSGHWGCDGVGLSRACAAKDEQQHLWNVDDEDNVVIRNSARQNENSTMTIHTTMGYVRRWLACPLLMLLSEPCTCLAIKCSAMQWTTVRSAVRNDFSPFGVYESVWCAVSFDSTWFCFVLFVGLSFRGVVSILLRWVGSPFRGASHSTSFLDRRTTQTKTALHQSGRVGLSGGLASGTVWFFPLSLCQPPSLSLSLSRCSRVVLVVLVVVSGGFTCFSLCCLLARLLARSLARFPASHLDCSNVPCVTMTSVHKSENETHRRRQAGTSRNAQQQPPPQPTRR